MEVLSTTWRGNDSPCPSCGYSYIHLCGKSRGSQVDIGKGTGNIMCLDNSDNMKQMLWTPGLGDSNGGFEKELDFWRAEMGAGCYFPPSPIWSWDIGVLLHKRLVRQQGILPASCGDLLSLQSPCEHPTLLTWLCILISWGGKGWDYIKILEVGLRNQGFLLLLFQEKATFSSLTSNLGS